MIDRATFKLRSSFLKGLLSLFRVRDLYQSVAEPPESPATASETRAKLTSLLTKADAQHPLFAGKLTAFIADAAALDDKGFFARYAQLPVFTKEDYRAAGAQAMSRAYADRIAELELHLDRGLRSTLKQLRGADFILPLATGGSSKLPLTVQMTKEHTFSNLFTFFRCWRQMGWRLGDKTLVFYPADTYNIDDLAGFNRFSSMTGFRFVLFRKLDSDTVRGLVETLNQFRPRLLLIFPSPLNLIAHMIRKRKLPLRHQPELISVGGETFLDCQRRNIKRVFAMSRIEDSYGSVELGKIAHEGPRGLEVFSDLAHVETRPLPSGQSELIVTRLDLVDFPFIRYQMRDLARLDGALDSEGVRALVGMEGKDTNFVRGLSGQRLYPSFFNRLTNAVNDGFPEPPIVDIKIVELSLGQWEVRLITQANSDRAAVERGVHEYLERELGDGARVSVHFVESFGHDYRLKYRVIEQRGETEYAGGIVGNEEKLKAVGREPVVSGEAS